MDTVVMNGVRRYELGKPSLKKEKSVTFFTLRSDPPPPYFPESVTKKQKKIIKLLKCNIKPS